METALSPFFNKDNPSPKHLCMVPKWCWRYTCRCNRYAEWVMDNERNMMVCDNCRLPSGFVVMLSADITGECHNCGNDFVVWRQRRDRKDYDLCSHCGGTNAARLGQKTQDINKTPIEDV
jgi:hypothetical protein